MKKLKKLFNLLPAFALAFISGLGVVLDNDQTIKPANADTYSRYPVHNEEFSSSVSTSYTFSTGLSTITNNTLFIINGTFSYYYEYNESGQQYYFGFQLRLSNCTSSYYGTFSLSSTDRIGLDTLVSTSITQFRIDLIRFEGLRRYNTNKIDVGFYFDIYLNGTRQNSYSVVKVVTLSNPNLTTGYTGFQGTANQTIMNIEYTPTDYDLAYADGYNAGYNSGFNNGYSSGQIGGYDNGYDAGYQAGVDSQQQAITDAFNNGYNEGYNQGFSVDSTAATIFSGILQIGMLPINILLAIFNFEILGINLSAFISAILTVCLTVIVIRTVTGGKNSE